MKSMYPVLNGSTHYCKIWAEHYKVRLKDLKLHLETNSIEYEEIFGKYSKYAK